MLLHKLFLFCMLHYSCNFTTYMTVEMYKFVGPQVDFNSKNCELKLNSSSLIESCLELKMILGSLIGLHLHQSIVLLIHHTLKLDTIHSNVEEL
jgi:hypothetical protein